MSIPLTLFHQSYGSSDAPAIVILHGVFGSQSNWGSIARVLQKDYQVFCVDLRNHGRSPHSDEMTYEAMAADVLHLIQEEVQKPVVLLGHSMGGKVAMLTALRNPEWIRMLIVADIAPVEYSHDFQDILDAMNHLDLRQVSSRKEIDQQLAPVIENQVLRQFLMKNLYRTEDCFAWRINLEVIGAAMSHLVGYVDISGSYDGPCLFLGGENSHYILPEYQPRSVELFPKARFVQLKNAGHWLHVEQPQAFLETMTYFIQKNET